MSGKYTNNEPGNDTTGEVLSWVIIFILMFAFPPVGILMLILRLRRYANAGSNARKTDANVSDAARRTAAGAANVARGASDAARQAAKDVQAAAREAAREAGAAAREFASEFTGNRREAPPNYSGYTKQASGDVPSGSSRDFRQTVDRPPVDRQPAKRKPVKIKNLSPLDRKSGKFLSVVLLLISITMFIIGTAGLLSAVQSFLGDGRNSWYSLIMGSFFLVGGFITFFSRNISVRRISRYKKYRLFVDGRGVVPIPDFARVSGSSVRAVTRDIQTMIDAGYFDQGAYIDSELDSLVLYPEAARAVREAAKRGDVRQETAPRQDEKPINQYMAIILELRALNDTIIDIPISDKIDRIEVLSAKIFRIVEENPEKLPQIRRFMNYYMPTTLKLLRSYATLEKQGIKGENITAAKENISRILDTLATGYEQQLDQLFRSDVIDIAADINVLENLMQQDGLTDDKQEFQVMRGSMQ